MAMTTRSSINVKARSNLFAGRTDSAERALSPSPRDARVGGTRREPAECIPPLREPTHPRPLPGGEQAFVRTVSVPLLGGVRGGFMVSMHSEKRKEALHEPEGRAGVSPVPVGEADGDLICFPIARKRSLGRRDACPTLGPMGFVPMLRIFPRHSYPSTGRDGAPFKSALPRRVQSWLTWFGSAWSSVVHFALSSHRL